VEVNMPPRIRLLIVEDSQYRIDAFEQWIPEDIVKVVARSAGAAVGILKRDKGRVYDGILLDHDLVRINEQDLTDGKDVVQAMLNFTSSDVPVLVHSANESEAPRMVERLTNAGFSVTRIRFSDLSRERFAEWMEEVRDNFEDAD